MNETGHMVFGAMVWNNLTDKTRQAVSKILADSNNPGYLPTTPEDSFSTTNPQAGFAMSSCWMDDYKLQARAKGLPDMGGEHFDNQPEGPAQFTTGAVDATPNIITSFNAALANVRNSATAPDLMALSLRKMNHEAGDAITPLHCVDEYNAMFPKGDEGGNKFMLNFELHSEYPGELHALWDQGGAHPDPKNPANTIAQFPSLKRPQTPGDTATINSVGTFVGNLAAQFQKAYPSTLWTTQQLSDFNVKDWTTESAGIVLNPATSPYTGVTNGQTLDPTKPADAAYLARAEQTMAKQVSLGAYRYANLLNSIFDSSSAAAQAMAGGPPHA